MGVRLSIIVPTIGRRSLDETLASIGPQLSAGDEVIVVADSANGDLDYTRLLAQVFPDGRWRYAEVPGDGQGIGGAQRAYGTLLAGGTHLAFMDDDDTYTPDAFAWMRAAAGDRPVIFKAEHPTLGTLWRERTLAYGNVSTQMFLIPNRPDELGDWRAHTADGHGADFTFITETVEKMGGCLFADRVVSVISQVGSRVAA